MLIGNPFVGNVNRTLNAQELLQAIRVDIAAELEAVLLYEAHAMATNDERAKKILKHIADEERKHVGEFEQLLAILSPGDGDKIQQGRQDVVTLQQSNFQIPLQ